MNSNVTVVDLDECPGCDALLDIVGAGLATEAMRADVLIRLLDDWRAVIRGVPVMARKPDRCFIYTNDAALDDAVTEGRVTPHDAAAIRAFAEQLRHARVRGDVTWPPEANPPVQG